MESLAKLCIKCDGLTVSNWCTETKFHMALRIIFDAYKSLVSFDKSSELMKILLLKCEKEMRM